MFKSSKSVGFEEYRDHCWQDAYNGDHHYHHHNEHRWNENEDKRTNDIPRFHNNKYEAETNFYEISPLPPSLEPRDRLVPTHCVDPTNWWKEHTRNSSSTPIQLENNIGRINNGYIMPSSLDPACNTLGTCIPPPTAYRDETESRVSAYNRQFLEDNNGHGHANENRNSDCDIIEIKRPGTVCILRNDSEYGLVHPYMTISQYELDSNAVNSSNQFWETASNSCASSQQPSRFHSHSGIFNLPEIYSPPPLSEPTSLLATDSSHMQRLMPSFFDTTGTSNEQLTKQYGFQGCQIRAPRMVYSEPILKGEREKSSTFSPNTIIRPETTRLSPRVRNKTFFEATTSDCEKKKSGGATMKTPAGQKLSIYCGDHHRLVPHEPINETSFPDADDSRGGRQKHDGSGDCNEFSIHNCLSPRARVARLQPSVITPEVTESLLGECLANLRSPHWEDNFEALSQIYNLTELHAGRVKGILNKVIWYSLPHLSSPRTKLARMACICFKRLYQTQKRSMETEGEKVFYRLLDLCGGLANNFIQQESRESLVAAVEHMDPLKSLSFLELHGAKHKNPHVREFSAYLLTAIMDELPQNKLMNKEFSPRIIPMIVSFLREGLLQTRLHAKLALDKVFDHPTFDCKLRRYVSPENVRHIADTLREFRERRNGHV